MGRSDALQRIVSADFVTARLTMIGENGYLLAEDLKSRNLCTIHNDRISALNFSISKLAKGKKLHRRKDLVNANSSVGLSSDLSTDLIKIIRSRGQ